MVQGSSPLTPTFCATPAAFRAWLDAHHATASELWVGFYKKGSGQPSITWPEAVDQALCFGWIDGIRKSVDTLSYTIRFTPRAARSTWSAVNIARVAELTALGLMRPAGLVAFEARTDARSAIYAYEQKNTALDAASVEQFRAHTTAWTFFQAQAPWYQRTAIWWVISAKKEDTQRTRLARLIDDSAQGRTLPQLTRRRPPL